MTATDHDAWRQLAAAHVVGALDAEERARFEAHLAGCAPCRAEVVDLAPLPALLSRVDAADLAPPPTDPAGAVAVASRVRDRLARSERSRRRWRSVAVAATAVAAVAGSVAALTGESPSPRRPGVTLAVESAPAGAEASLVAQPTRWGTYLHVAAEGLPDRAEYRIWVVGVDGGWEAVGSWAPDGTSPVSLGSSTGLAIESIDRVVVTSTDRDDQLLVAR